ncbi:hypothetical protein Lalb_Chr17g0345571 [Lupinus albus]|uniref:Epidermal patterning factor-like protein n=1 Tax=Lupinus albus TaxID=3870 RepID=A0A6A4NQV3_LUPAL|nr:hypothetical protein Lalb_Chr17g0345571 [Lupinus albus]
MERKRNTTRLCRNVSFFIFLLLIFTLIFSSSITTCLDTSNCPMFTKADKDFRELEEKIGEQMVTESKGEIEMGWGRRLLVGGAGSFPPRCTSKCGNCTPCKPVHVPVPPGTPVTAEYYPEAWRCKCANKYYMP